MRLDVITPATVEPLTLAEAKLHLRVTWAKEDDLINRLIVGARQAFERDTGRQLITATYEGFIDGFPQFDDKAIDISKPPLLAVNSVTYFDPSNVLQTWLAAEYTAKAFSGPFARRGMVYPSGLNQYPLARRIPNAITINFDAGYGATAADVPDDIKEALLGWIAFHYVNREPVVTGTIATKIPGLGFDPWLEYDFG